MENRILEEATMKKRLRAGLILGILLWSASALSAESIQKYFYPHLTIEKGLIMGDITGKDRYGFDMNYKPMDMAALGLTFQKSHLSASVSLAAPWRKSKHGSSSIHPGVDMNLAFQMKNVYVYGGYFASLKKEDKWDEEKVISPVYAGLGFKQRIKNIGLDFGFQASWGRYTDYWQFAGPKRNITSYALVTKIGYDFQKAVHPFLSFSLGKLNSVDKLAFRLALGITLGKKVPMTQASPLIIEQTAMVVVYKPNIYLYPEKEERVTVIVTPNGKITVSDPPYNRGWQVTAHPDGSIDNTSGFLFYEALVAVDAPKEGWCISPETMASFFKKILADYGFRDKEIADFLDYWVPKLSKSPFYVVHPVLNKNLEKVCPLQVTPAPARVLRVWFVFKPSATAVSLKEPKIPSFQRSGFVITEWGGIMR